jgi:zinc and cadmium transporter
MQPWIELAVLSLVLLLGTLVAAWVPLRWKPRPHQTDGVIALAAGILLGAAFFHLLPEAVHQRGARVLLGALGGALTLLLLERGLRWIARRHGDVEVHAMMHTHAHELAGWAAFFGLSVHTLSDGFALASAIAPGLAPVVFTAIFAHQLPTAFSLSTLLQRGQRSAATTLAACAVFGLMLPVGGALYLLAANGAAGVGLMPWALAFSAGNFLHLALNDLLPDLTRSGAKRTVLAAVGLAGFGGMGVLRLLLGD